MLHNYDKLVLTSGRSGRRHGRGIGRQCLPLMIAAAGLLRPLIRAQVTSGTIFGSVKDSTGAMIDNAAITATEPSIGVTRKSKLFIKS